MSEDHEDPRKWDISKHYSTVATVGRRTTYTLGQTSQKLKCNIPGVATLPLSFVGLEMVQTT